MEESLNISTLDYKGLQGIRYKKILKMNTENKSLSACFLFFSPGSRFAFGLVIEWKSRRYCAHLCKNLFLFQNEIHVLRHLIFQYYLKSRISYAWTTVERVVDISNATLLIFSRRGIRISMTSNVRILNFLALFSSFFPFQLSWNAVEWRQQGRLHSFYASEDLYQPDNGEELNTNDNFLLKRNLSSLCK